MTAKNKEIDYKEGLDPIDLNNYKGIFYENTEQKKYQDEITGAHFEYHDMVKRLTKLQEQLQFCNLKAPTLIRLMRDKEKRNEVQQGYETIGANHKSYLVCGRNNRQFSTQFESLLRFKRTINNDYNSAINVSHENNNKAALDKKLVQIISNWRKCAPYKT